MKGPSIHAAMPATLMDPFANNHELAAGSSAPFYSVSLGALSDVATLQMMWAPFESFLSLPRVPIDMQFGMAVSTSSSIIILHSCSESTERGREGVGEKGKLSDFVQD